jgi:hypothetical protein
VAGRDVSFEFLLQQRPELGGGRKHHRADDEDLLLIATLNCFSNTKAFDSFVVGDQNGHSNPLMHRKRRTSLAALDVRNLVSRFPESFPQQ